MPRYAVTVLAHINRTVIVDADDEDIACLAAELQTRAHLLQSVPTEDLVAVEAIEAAPHAEADL